MSARTAISLFLTFLLLARVALASNSVHNACRKLCENTADCTKRCVSHAELFEINATLVQASTDFSPQVEMRMKVLRSGADLSTLALCKQTGWSPDNTLTCLRSYPSPEILISCKKLSAQEEEQVRCLRAGRSSAHVDSCVTFSKLGKERLECLQKDVTAIDVRECRRNNETVPGRATCLEKIVKAQEEEGRRFEQEVRTRMLAEEGGKKRALEQRRMPASGTKKTK